MGFSLLRRTVRKLGVRQRCSHIHTGSSGHHLATERARQATVGWRCRDSTTTRARSTVRAHGSLVSRPRRKHQRPQAASGERTRPRCCRSGAGRACAVRPGLSVTCWRSAQAGPCQPEIWRHPRGPHHMGARRRRMPLLSSPFHRSPTQKGGRRFNINAAWGGDGLSTFHQLCSSPGVSPTHSRNHLSTD